MANQPSIRPSVPHPRLEKVGPYLAIATLQAYTVLTVVRCLADPMWITLRTGADMIPGVQAEIGRMEKSFLACAIVFTMLSCIGVTLRIMDKFPWLRRIPVLTAYLEAIFCTAALITFLSTHSLPPGGQFSHGFLACVITVIFSTIVAIMLSVDWYRGFPSAGLSATLKALIISSFVMTIVIIIGAAIYHTLEDWKFDTAVHFCIVSFATIGYGNVVAKTTAGKIIFFFYGILGISSMGFFVVSLRNAVIEQFQWRLVDRFSKPAHLTRVQTRMSAKDISFPAARLEEEQRVKVVVKRKMILRMVCIWIVMWFGGAGVFCSLEEWNYLDSLYFCFVTLTTIGFGDIVPQEPGAIEFWSVYVFVGLAVFAYILSLSSESMASHIHLVDDQDEDDDADMYGWERNEDPNAPLTTRSGILGLEGLKWAYHQQQLQRQGSNPDVAVDQEGKAVEVNNDDDAHNLDVDDSLNEDQALRYRPRRRTSTGRILTVSAKERKQMLQAEYYATHSLPTTIRFVDTKGMPHHKTVGRSSTMGNPATGSIDPLDEQQHFTYGTIGYYGSVGQGMDGLPRTASRRDGQSFRGVGVANHGTMYGAGSSQLSNAVQTQLLKHQPVIKFDSPKRSNHNAGVQPSNRTDRILQDQQGLDDQRDSRHGYIPSCMDVFRQNKKQDDLPKDTLQPEPARTNTQPPRRRHRSNSWDASATSHRAGPSENEVHRWVAEGAGTSSAPDFKPSGETSQSGLLDTGFQSHQPRPSQGSDVTKVTSPFLGSSGSQLSSQRSVPDSTLVDFGGLRPVLGEQRYHCEGIAPDEMPVQWTAEPEQMSMSDQKNVDAVQDTTQTAQSSMPFSRTPPQGSPATLLSEPANTTKQSADNIQPIGYGSEAREATAEVPDAAPRTGMNTDFVIPSMAPASLFDESLDHQHTLHPTTSRPLSLFSNHGRSGHNSSMSSPAGSRHSSRPPSVLMTIFDTPVANPAGSRPVSRNGSLVGGSRVMSRNSSLSQLHQQYQQQQHLQHAQAPPQHLSQIHHAPGSVPLHGLGLGIQGTGTVEHGASGGQGGVVQEPPTLLYEPGNRNISGPGTEPGVGAVTGAIGYDHPGARSPAYSDISVGPFDETRTPNNIPHFDDDVDLNHVECPPQQKEEEHRRRAELRRRQREIEAQLQAEASAGAGVSNKNHPADQEQHH
ncbi:Potassium channel [Haplosporangium sp. Z 767]|nr:Potassium channel [Haplosporangium sp. Z 767]